jgi:hypothetical protein
MNPDSSPTTPRPDAALLALRPAVATEAAPVTAGAASVGDFLHRTLRPVLKLQNDLLLAAVADFVADHHIPLAKASPTDQQRLLAELLARNTKLRYTLVGLVTGTFTAEEYAFYRQHRGEVNRRLHELAQRRVLDQTNRVIDLAADAADSALPGS